MASVAVASFPLFSSSRHTWKYEGLIDINDLGLGDGGVIAAIGDSRGRQMYVGKYNIRNDLFVLSPDQKSVTVRLWNSGS